MVELADRIETLSDRYRADVSLEFVYGRHTWRIRIDTKPNQTVFRGQTATQAFQAAEAK